MTLERNTPGKGSSAWTGSPSKSNRPFADLTMISTLSLRSQAPSGGLTMGPLSLARPTATAKTAAAAASLHVDAANGTGMLA